MAIYSAAIVKVLPDPAEALYTVSGALFMVLLKKYVDLL
jgi:hypothetical protein